MKKMHILFLVSTNLVWPQTLHLIVQFFSTQNEVASANNMNVKLLSHYLLCVALFRHLCFGILNIIGPKIISYNDLCKFKVLNRLIPLILLFIIIYELDENNSKHTLPLLCMSILEFLLCLPLGGFFDQISRRFSVNPTDFPISFNLFKGLLQTLLSTCSLLAFKVKWYWLLINSSLQLCMIWASFKEQGNDIRIIYSFTILCAIITYIIFSEIECVIFLRTVLTDLSCLKVIFVHTILACLSLIFIRLNNQPAPLLN